MNVNRMQYEFGMQMNQFSEPLALASDDILYWLNKAQEMFVISRYNGNNLVGKAFEQSQQLIDDLRVLLVKDEHLDVRYLGNSLSAIDEFHADYAEFPDNQLFLINQKSEVSYHFPEISYSTASDKRVADSTHRNMVVSNRYSQSDDVFKLLSDPFNKTKSTSPLTDISEKGITIYTDKTFLVKDVIITYIRRAKELSLTEDNNSYTTVCELPQHTHKEIIQLAVDLFLQNTRELKQRLQRETPTADKQQNVEENE